MTRRLIASVVVLFLAVTAGADEKTKAEKPAAAHAPYVHVVLFTLKKDAPSDALSSMIADCHEMLAKVPSVRGLRVGRPSEDGTPNLAKKTYDAALLVLVDDAAGLKAYLEHPLHLKFVEKHLKFIEMEKLQVFDFVDQKK